jgi:hypothetical protein
LPFLLYSSYTSLTGPRLAKGLNISWGEESPRETDFLINYGAGSGFDIPRGVKKILNHPNSIRGKVGMLRLLIGHPTKVSIPYFSTAEALSADLQSGKMTYPFIGRTRSHQDGSGFFFCRSQRDYQRAFEMGATHFQKAESIKDEYRVHVIMGEVVVAYIKTFARDPLQFALKEVMGDFNTRFPNCREGELDKVSWAIKRTLKCATLPDLLVRTPSRGWCYTQVPNNNLPVKVKQMCLDAMQISGMDFGAIDIIINNEGAVKLLEINSGPGMDVDSLDYRIYVSNFKKQIEKYTAPRTPARANFRTPAINIAWTQTNRGVVYGGTRRPAH